jgi:hypothetical protein
MDKKAWLVLIGISFFILFLIIGISIKISSESKFEKHKKIIEPKQDVKISDKLIPPRDTSIVNDSVSSVMLVETINKLIPWIIALPFIVVIGSVLSTFFRFDN